MRRAADLVHGLKPPLGLPELASVWVESPNRELVRLLLGNPKFGGWRYRRTQSGN